MTKGQSYRITHKWLTPMAVPFILPCKRGRGFFWTEHSKDRAKELLVFGAGAGVVAGIFLLCLLVDPRPVFLWILALASCVATFLIVRHGFRLWRSSRELHIESGMARLTHRRGRHPSTFECGLDECTLEVNQVWHRPARGPQWDGFAATVHFNDERAPIILAAAKNEELVRRYAQACAPSGLTAIEGGPLVGGVSTWIGRRTLRLERGMCPRCRAALEHNLLDGCLACSWNRPDRLG